MAVQLPRLLFTEIIATSVSSKHTHNNNQQQHSSSTSTSHVEHYLMVSPAERARHLGYRIRLGSLLWHSPLSSTTTTNNNNNNDNNNNYTCDMERGEVKDKKGSKLSKEMIIALEQNWVSLEMVMYYDSDDC